MVKFIALAYGVVVYLFFFVTFLYAIGFTGNLFVPKSIDTGAEPITLGAFTINIILLGIFAIQHSIMARPAFKRWWTRYISKPIERSTFVLFATLALALLIWKWRAISGTVWAVEDPTGRLILYVLFFAGWGIVLAGTFMENHFHLLGVRQVFMYARGRSFSELQFRPMGFYTYLRQPILLGYLIAFWATPVMTAGHLLFSIVTSAYIFIGMVLQERDMSVHFGEPYKSYRRVVPALIPLPGRRAPKPEAGSAGDSP